MHISATIFFLIAIALYAASAVPGAVAFGILGLFLSWKLGYSGLLTSVKTRAMTRQTRLAEHWLSALPNNRPALDAAVALGSQFADHLCRAREAGRWATSHT